MDYQTNQRILTITKNIEDSIAHLQQIFELEDEVLCLEQLNTIYCQMQSFQLFYKNKQKEKI
jgi:hypothetical protein